MKYLLHTSPKSTEINRLVVIYPGMDAGMHEGRPTTSNDINKYNVLAKLTAAMSEPGVAVVAVEYQGPHLWGKPIDFNILTSDIEQTLLAAMHELAKTNLPINVANVSLCSHSYGFTPLFWSLANDIYSKVIGTEYKGGTKLHIFEPYGIAAMKAAKENSPAYREHEVVAAAQQLFPSLAVSENPKLAAERELKQLRGFDTHFQVQSIDLIFGLFRPSTSIHASYGAVDADITGVTKSYFAGVGHGGAFKEVLTATEKLTTLPDYAEKGFLILMTAWIASLHGINSSDSSEVAKAVRDEILNKLQELCISENLMAQPKATEQQEVLANQMQVLKM